MTSANVYVRAVVWRAVPGARKRRDWKYSGALFRFPGVHYHQLRLLVIHDVRERQAFALLEGAPSMARGDAAT